MITTNVGGLAEIVPHEKVGYVINPDVNELAKSIEKYFVENREKEFIENVKIEKAKYSWSNMLGSIESILNDLKSN